MIERTQMIASVSNLVQKLTKELESEKKKLEELQKGMSEIDTCFLEADKIIDRMDDWMKKMMPTNGRILFSYMPASVLFLGGCSGQWAARSRYTGRLPGFGGFLIVADGRLILIDPGLSTVDGLIAAGIPPSSLDSIVVTHNHWDCTRELGLVLMAASGPAPELLSDSRGSPLRLFASKSVVHGLPMDVDAVLAHKSDFPEWPSEEALRTRVEAFACSLPAALNAYDIFGRLRGNVHCLDLQERYEISPVVRFFTRPSYHSETYGAEVIPGLDFIVEANEGRRARIAYLSDSEYRPHLHEPYSDAVKELGQIDLLITNVKTLSVFPYKEGPLEGYTRRQLGWNGVLQLTRDLKRSGALSETSLVVLRAWGIETVTRLDPENGALVATPEKLGVYEKVFTNETEQPALVPGRTWIGLPGVQGSSPSTYYLQRPFQTQGTGSRFGKVHYRSQAMTKVVQAAMAVMGTPQQSVLITGESGCGKDLIAREIHDQASASGLREKDNIRIKQCSELVSSLGHSQLSGLTDGIFTSAKDKRGWLAQTANGTLVFDEIQNMSWEAQGQFLTLLQERKYQPMGDDKEQNLTAQVIFTANPDAGDPGAQGLVREDLFYRTRQIHIPPLRERKEDIEAIVRGWHHEGELPQNALDKKIIALLEHYPWPGNVRQLKNVLTEIKGTGDWSLDNVRRTAVHSHESDEVKKLQKPHQPQPREYLEPIQKKILRLLSPEEPMSRMKVQQLLAKEAEGGMGRGFSKATVVNHLRRLMDSNLVVKVAKGPNTGYLLNLEAAGKLADGLQGGAGLVESFHKKPTGHLLRILDGSP